MISLGRSRLLINFLSSHLCNCSCTNPVICYASVESNPSNGIERRGLERIKNFFSNTELQRPGIRLKKYVCKWDSSERLLGLVTETVVTAMLEESDLNSLGWWVHFWVHFLTKLLIEVVETPEQLSIQNHSPGNLILSIFHVRKEGNPAGQNDDLIRCKEKLKRFKNIVRKTFENYQFSRMETLKKAPIRLYD